MIEMFKEWYDTRHEYAKYWKEKNPDGRVIGYFCTYVPEEILYAFNCLPVRILGSHQSQNVTEPHIFGMYCPFCRDCLAQGLEGRYDYLDGVMIAQSCLHIRQAFTSWQLHVDTPWSYYLPMPHHVQSPERAVTFLTAEYAELIKALEKLTGRTINDDDLRRGIGVMNESRLAMRDLYETRKADNPPLTGLEAMYAAVTEQWIDKSEHARIVREVIGKDLPNRDLGLADKTRLMLFGSEDDDSEFVKMVESCGAAIVIDDHCTGSRYFWNNVQLDGLDPLAAIARRYVLRPPCPTKDWPARTRLDHVLKLAKEWNCAGAVVLQQKFCDPHELDIPEQRKSLEANDIKTLFLELDVTVPVGQFRIRLEAFLETLSEEDLF
ncbi:MAG: benzoyl-CoA reductase, bzd-type, subunit N [Deltaproteobacteria bacterium]|nr:benzoyl-CoA reductase, bzd-type, subunit N [Deltaproteobacteria bacterium]